MNGVEAEVLSIKKLTHSFLTRLILKFFVSYDQTGIKLQASFTLIPVKESQILVTESILYQHKIC